MQKKSRLFLFVEILVYTCKFPGKNTVDKLLADVQFSRGVNPVWPAITNAALPFLLTGITDPQGNFGVKGHHLEIQPVNVKENN
ncbi:hypothetical protein [Pollutibacter soli]|uniref:hypothetical protein n=1 Tax=Pollutibacter soli TaxID=3034157 RepID=UPI0030134334